ncbi:hypothetical protein GF325_14615, partial [Candidatus Bathyarchaeota archaeon]|nr:hypothetical protein [Candidatus Bathyarchaeota archaeon]
MAEEEKTEVKDSNELLNIFLIIIGAIYIFQGIVYYVELYKPGSFGWLPDIIYDSLIDGGAGVDTFKSMMGSSATMRTVLGGFCFISGVGMFKEQEWGWGMAIVLLSVILVTTTGDVINNFINWNNSLLTSWPFWIQII